MMSLMSSLSNRASGDEGGQDLRRNYKAKWWMPLLLLVCMTNIFTLPRTQGLFSQLINPASTHEQTLHHHDRIDSAKSAVSNDPFEVCDPKNFLVLIKAGSKSKYQDRRKIWRGSNCRTSYQNHGIRYRFMLAMPAHEIINPNGHNQGARASEKEIHDMKELRNEYLVNGDMEFLPLKDVYDDSNLKVISMLRWAVDRGMNDRTSTVVLHDDEYCLRPRALRDICANATGSNRSLYAGWNLWKSAGYDSQKAFDGSFAPYFGGWVYAMSSDLVRDIAYDPETLFTSTVLGYAEDLQAGKWVKNQAEHKDHPRKVMYVQEESLGMDLEADETQNTKGEKEIGSSDGKEAVDRVSCGNHDAKSCEECPQVIEKVGAMAIVSGEGRANRKRNARDEVSLGW
eukprot:CAMPEP_0172554538 /NCGR_PEP_ID=MMETSP1067-20121228/55129_1 /TAXON_ID=265564 ORGANISM="Thalassiosira punctigera, Strain Tpunct2005C2" /NCGR_SAMPLE_ID=MMETSP1067 /ASSEMBLY_ACC=CAM_ASM_000444 /LENGTH=397 /DNA_ID=CAMNT_0013342933 /DNA_START=41 /DNA_END=1232 /DNA_ORIENTATION=-